MNKEQEDILNELARLSQNFDKVHKELEEKSEDYWNHLSKDEQLKVFCAVVRRLYDGEIVQKRSYRGVLYDVFGFGMEAYGQAQMAGFLTLHNCIYTPEYEHKLLEAFCIKHKLDPKLATDWMM